MSDKNGQCWVWGQVGEGIGGMEMMPFFVGNVSSSFCFRGFDVSVRPALTDSPSINQKNLVLCHTLTHSFITQKGARSLDFFFLLNSFFWVTVWTASLHVCLGIMDVWHDSVFCGNTIFFSEKNKSSRGHLVFLLVAAGIFCTSQPLSKG